MHNIEENGKKPASKTVHIIIANAHPQLHLVFFDQKVSACQIYDDRPSSKQTSKLILQQKYSLA